MLKKFLTVLETFFSLNERHPELCFFIDNNDLNIDLTAKFLNMESIIGTITITDRLENGSIIRSVIINRGYIDKNILELRSDIEKSINEFYETKTVSSENGDSESETEVDIEKYTNIFTNVVSYFMFCIYTLDTINITNQCYHFDLPLSIETIKECSTDIYQKRGGDLTSFTIKQFILNQLSGNYTIEQLFNNSLTIACTKPQICAQFDKLRQNNYIHYLNNIFNNRKLFLQGYIPRTPNKKYIEYFGGYLINNKKIPEKVTHPDGTVEHNFSNSTQGWNIITCDQKLKNYNIDNFLIWMIEALFNNLYIYIGLELNSDVLEAFRWSDGATHDGILHGRHALVIVGFQIKRENERDVGYFNIKNSWGFSRKNTEISVNMLKDIFLEKNNINASIIIPSYACNYIKDPKRYYSDTENLLDYWTKLKSVIPSAPSSATFPSAPSSAPSSATFPSATFPSAPSSATFPRGGFFQYFKQIKHNTKRKHINYKTRRIANKKNNKTKRKNNNKKTTHKNK
jgi:hypothetical protein